MRTLSTSAILGSFLLVAGCNNAKSPETVAKDVASAEQSASKEVSKSEDSAAKDVDSAANKVNDKLVDLNNVAAKDGYNIAVAKADGDRKIALANCQAMAGAAQKTCKDQAEADYTAAQASAKAASVSEKQ